MALRVKLLTTIVVPALAIAVAGCSSSGDGSNTGNDSTAAAPTAGASSGAANTNCTGPAVKIMAIGGFDTGGAVYQPSLLAGPQAAAKAINATCELGRPISIVACNDHSTTQGALTCGQKAVSDGVIAVIGHPLSDAYISALATRKIPAIQPLANAAQELTYEYSYPIATGPSLIFASVTLAADLGAKKVQMLTYGGPQVELFDSLIKAAASNVGLEQLPNLVAPTSTTDMTAYAAQAIAGGADAIVFGTTAAQIVSFTKALHAQGADTNKLKLIGGPSLTTAVLQELGDNAEGIYSANEVADPGDTSNPGIRQMLDDLRANGTPMDGLHVEQLTVGSWTATHIVADAMKGASSFTPAELGERLNSLPPDFYKAYPSVPPFDFSKNAFPAIPALSKLRMFSNQMAVLRVKDGKFTNIVDGYIPVDKKTNLQ